MADTKIVFGIKIILNDHASKVSADASIGLYNVTSDMAANANSGQKDITTDDGTYFEEGGTVTIIDDNDSEQGVIDSVAGNVVTMKKNLTNSYITAANGRVDGCSEFRWLQNTISGVSNWLAGMITEKGLGKWTKIINLKRGGNLSQAGAASVKIQNTSQFWNSLQTKEIYLNGLRSEIYEFQNTTSARQWSGICEKPTWNTKEYIIPMRGYINKRIANIGSLINSTGYPNASGDILSKSIPSTFGEIKPEFDSDGNVIYNGYAEFTRTADKVDKFEASDEKIDLDDIVLECDPDDIQVFPIVGNDGETPTREYKIKVGLTGIGWYQSGGVTQITSGTHDVDFFENYYIDVAEGTEEGSFRSINSCYVDIDTDSSILIAGIDDYFSETLSGNATATAADNSWVTLDDIHRQYKPDAWPCFGFIDSTGATLTSGLELYSYSDEKTAKVTTENTDARIDETPIKFFRLPDYGYENSVEGDNNLLDIDANLFDGNPDQMDSFLIKPVVNPILASESADTVSANWNNLGINSKIQNGLYAVPALPPTLSMSSSGNISSITDRNQDTAITYTVLHSPDPLSRNLYFIMYFNLPEFPKNFTFDNVYLGFRIFINAVVGTPDIIYIGFLSRRFTGNATTLYARDGLIPAGKDMLVDNILDEYYLSRSTNNKNFYYSTVYYETIGGSSHEVIPGYTTIEISDIKNESMYNSIQQLALIVKMYSVTTESYSFGIHEMSTIFRKSVSIKKAIYSPFKGRIFNDTWDGRKTSTDLIESPPDILEHFNRLQCWEDTSPPPTNGWGLDYADGARIKTGSTADGSFDDTTDSSYTILSTFKTAGQIPQYEKSYTDKLKKQLCRDFFIASYTDKDGFECVKRIVKSETSPFDTVTLSDIVDRTKIRIKEPSPSDIFPEPFVNYRLNFASGKYESVIKVTNVDATTFNSNYVEGISAADEAEELWDKCAILFQKCKHLEKPPKDMTDKIWFNGPNADLIARDYIFNWVDWMFNPVVRFTVHYNKSGSWSEAHKFTLQLPHQTNNVAFECITTRVSVNPNPPYNVDIEAIMLREDIPEEFFIKDTWINYSSDDDWKDTMTVYGNDNDKKDVM